MLLIYLVHPLIGKLIYPFPKEVMSIDNRILMDERIQNMGEPPMAWDKYEENER